MRFVLRLSVLAGMLFALWVAPAQAQQVRDQEQTVATGYAVVFQDASRAQVFTAGRTGTLDRIDLVLFRGATAEPLAVEIRDAPGGSPGTTVLASATLMPADVPAGEGAAAFVPITFTPGAPVVAGAQYAIVLYSTADPSLETGYYWGRSGSTRPQPPEVDGYPGGNAYSSATTPPSGWIDLFLADQAFITYVTVAPVDGGQVSLPAVVRSSTTWMLRNSQTTGPADTIFSYGAKPLTPLMGDWDGNGSRTPGTFERGVFKLRNSNSAGDPDITFAFGDPRGFPVAGDFNGDRVDDVAVYRAGTWQVRYSTGAQLAPFTFGSGSWPFTVPVAGDWDGDGTDGIGTYSVSTATWSLRNTASPGAPEIGPFVFGTPNETYPVVGDWDGDGDDTVAVKQVAGSTWSLRNSNSAGAADRTFDFGLANDLPLSWRTG